MNEGRRPAWRAVNQCSVGGRPAVCVIAMRPSHSQSGRYATRCFVVCSVSLHGDCLHVSCIASQWHTVWQLYDARLSSQLGRRLVVRSWSCRCQLDHRWETFHFSVNVITARHVEILCCFHPSPISVENMHTSGRPTAPVQRRLQAKTSCVSTGLEQ